MENRNSNLSEELRDVLKLQQNVDGIISKVNPIIQPVINVNPKHARKLNFFKRVILSNSTSATTSCANDRDTFITGVTMSMIKDATSTSTSMNMTVVQDGASINLASMVGITLTPDSKDLAIYFSEPIKIDRGSTLTINSDTNVANFKIMGNFIGFTLENNNA